MKESGIDWIGQIPEEWELGRVKDFYKFFTGFTPDTSRVEYYGDINDFVWVTIADMTSKKIESSKQTLSDIFIKEKRPQVSRLGSLLYSFKLSVGKVAFANTDLYTNEAIATFEDGPNINLRFLYYSSYLIEFNSETNIYGAKLLNSDRIRNACIVQPSLSEQTKIADFLDKKTAQLDKAKALLEEQIQKLKDYRASLIYETVTKGLDKTVPMKDSGIDWIGQVPEGWGVKPLKYLASYDDETLTQSEINSNRKIDYVDISSVEFTKGINGHQEFSTLEAPSRARKIAKKGDTIISTVRTYLKAIAYVNNDYIVSTGFCVVRPKKINSKYLNYTIMSDSFTGPVSKYAWGVSYPAISSSQLVNIPIPFPESIEEQLSIVDYLDHKMLQINQLIDIKQEQIENINKQRQTLIYDYVTGKRRV